jgi:hypothetical protein
LNSPVTPPQARSAAAKPVRHAGSGKEAAFMKIPMTQVTESLDDAECRRLLATVAFGRLVFTRDALPAVQVLRYCLRGAQILMPIRAGSALSRAVRGAVVAFEADCVDPLTETGWTITAVGPAHVLTEPHDVAAAEQLGLQIWIPSAPYSYLAVEIGTLHGCRVARVRDRASPSATIAVLPHILE